MLPLTIFSNGWLGVNLFFILSGFVLFYPFSLQQRSMLDWADCRKFYSRRARRLLPLFYFSLFVFLAADYALYDKLPSAQELLLYITGTFNFSGDTFFPSVNWVLWSLGLEIWFSALFPLLLVACRRSSVTKVLIFAVLISLAVRISGNQQIGADLYLNPIKDSVLGRLDDFVFGMWLCHLYRNPPDWRMSSPGLFGIGMLAIVLVSSSWDYIELGMMSREIRPYLNNLFQVGSACIIFSILVLDTSRLSAWLSSRALQLAGMMTYSIYIWHGRLIAILNDQFGIAAASGIVNMLIYLFVLLAISTATYRFIEFSHVKDAKSIFKVAD